MNTTLGIAGAVVALVVIAVAILSTTREDRLTTVESMPRPLAAEIPPIDAGVPDELETATFALG